MIPYARQSIDEDDKKAVLDVLSSDWLTTGPKIDEFEQTVADYVGARYALAVSSGTAALHCAMYAIGIAPGDEVIVPPMTFAATANCIVYQGGTPVFADVEPDILVLDPNKVEEKITKDTKAIIAVDYAGHPCDYDKLRSICEHNGLFLIADACHSIGAEYKGRKVGSLADLTVFSFHPVKHITTGEGGMIATKYLKFAELMKRFRNHGISKNVSQRNRDNTWQYEIVDLGFNYRLTDIQCALGISQLKRLPEFLIRRRRIAQIYDEAFAASSVIHPLKSKRNINHAYHLYVVSVNFDKIGRSRQEIFQTLRENGIGVNVHYIPVHLHPYYKKTFGTGISDCPVAEHMYEKIISLPIYPTMSNRQISTVIQTIQKIIK